MLHKPTHVTHTHVALIYICYTHLHMLHTRTYVTHTCRNILHTQVNIGTIKRPKLVVSRFVFKDCAHHHQPSHISPKYYHNMLAISFTMLWKTHTIVTVLWEYCQHIVTIVYTILSTSTIRLPYMALDSPYTNILYIVNEKRYINFFEY